MKVENAGFNESPRLLPANHGSLPVLLRLTRDFISCKFLTEYQRRICWAIAHSISVWDFMIGSGRSTMRFMASNDDYRVTHSSGASGMALFST
ncbi:hypothetical protein N7478_003461 [Penicillium angulare]|uniref:uncharacterized protein n=1 Tax=Penicillium angulare TaxID=116970 RepID=UPI00253FFE01|nr:uncharacterized protein N7478_003461 [Penicillium angulare]KAJ5287775.1 hypothetical protein N7478_003461 [Penicillium angulare]